MKQGPQMSTAARSAKVRISLKALSPRARPTPLPPRLAGNKARAGLNGNPACEARVSKVARRQQMNPVVEVAEAMMWRRVETGASERFLPGYPGRI